MKLNMIREKPEAEMSGEGQTTGVVGLIVTLEGDSV